VPCSWTTGIEDGDEIVPPSSQHGAAEPQGSHAGAPQAGAIGAPQAGAIGAPQAGAALPREPHGERNSMNDGRRQELPPPKQLLHPGAASRLPRISVRQSERDMVGFSRSVVRDDAAKP
jgi:hypothetical protein